ACSSRSLLGASSLRRRRDDGRTGLNRGVLARRGGPLAAWEAVANRRGWAARPGNGRPAGRPRRTGRGGPAAALAQRLAIGTTLARRSTVIGWQLQALERLGGDSGALSLVQAVAEANRTTTNITKLVPPLLG